MVARILGCLSICLSLPAFGFAEYSILNKDFNFKCSTNQNIGCEGVFPINSDDTSEFAIVKSGEDAFALRAQSILNAKKSIRIQAFVFTGDEAGLHLADLLIKRKKEDNLDIKVIVDAYFNAGMQTQAMYYDLKINGIEVEGYETGPLEWVNEIDLTDWYRGNKRFHDKMWVVDAETNDAFALIGGINIANEYFRVGPEASARWKDQDIALKGNIVKDITKAFDRNYAYLKRQKEMKTPIFNTDNHWYLWKSVTEVGGERPAVFTTWYFQRDEEKQQTVNNFSERKVDLHFAKAPSRFVQSRPRFKETYITQTYLDMINSAQKEIILVNAYFIPSDEIIAALKTASVKRGVQVTILTNSAETNNHQIAQTVARSMYHDLLSTNKNPHKKTIKIYEWRGDLYEEGTLHSKFALFDQRAAIVGAYNIDPRGESLNSETVIVFENSDLVTEMRQIVMESDLKKSQKVSLSQSLAYKKPPNLIDTLKLNLAILFKSQL